MQVWPSQEVSLSGKRTAFICQETSLDQVGSVPMSASPQGLVVQFWIAVFSSPLMFAPCSFSVLPAASTNRVPSTRTLSPVVPLELLAGVLPGAVGGKDGLEGNPAGLSFFVCD